MAKETFQAQATRSFGDYLQGVWYTVDPEDEQIMSLLGAGYFSTEGNENLTTASVAYHPNVGTHEIMGAQEHENIEQGYQPANDVQVPAKMTGTKRATTADEESGTGGAVGTGQGGDPDDGQRARPAPRKQSGARNN